MLHQTQCRVSHPRVVLEAVRLFLHGLWFVTDWQELADSILVSLMGVLSDPEARRLIRPMGSLEVMLSVLTSQISTWYPNRELCCPCSQSLTRLYVAFVAQAGKPCRTTRSTSGRLPDTPLLRACAHGRCGLQTPLTSLLLYLPPYLPHPVPPSFPTIPLSPASSTSYIPLPPTSLYLPHPPSVSAFFKSSSMLVVADADAAQLLLTLHCVNRALSCCCPTLGACRRW